MRSVLVSGPADQADELATALREVGFHTFGLDLPPSLGTGAAGPRPVRSVDCYVQLAGDGTGWGSPTRTVMRRVQAVTLVTPLLAHDATVLLVDDDCDGRRREALRLLVEAAIDDGISERRVVVLDEDSLPEWLAVEHSFAGIVEGFRSNG
ncbi:MAG: hypothetical protein ACRDKW_12135 [Actinomycetota bacterium]